jgi:hypothetical protein
MNLEIVNAVACFINRIAIIIDKSMNVYDASRVVILLLE